MDKLGMDFPTAWGRTYSARVVRNLMHVGFILPYTRYLSTLDVQGLENIVGSGPFVFVANHTSNLDTPLVLAALPSRIRQRLVVAAAMDNFFMDSWKAFRTVLMFNAIPIDRHKVNRRSAQQTLELVQDRWNLLIYPEGGRTPNGNLQEFKGGAAYVAQRSQAIVIPTYIHGSGLLQGPKWAKAPQYVNGPYERRHHVTITFGPALRCEEGENIRRFSVRIDEAVIGLGRLVSGDENYGVKPPTGY